MFPASCRKDELMVMIQNDLKDTRYLMVCQTSDAASRQCQREAPP